MGSRAPIVAVVDDDKIFQFTAAKIIKDARLAEQILQFENGEEGLNFIKKHQRDEARLPDVILLDINMPLLDGWMFLEDYNLLKINLPKPITIFMVSSSIDPRDISRAESNENVKAYIEKPMTREKFKDVIQEAL